LKDELRRTQQQLQQVCFTNTSGLPLTLNLALSTHMSKLWKELSAAKSTSEERIQAALSALRDEYAVKLEKAAEVEVKALLTSCVKRGDAFSRRSEVQALCHLSCRIYSFHLLSIVLFALICFPVIRWFQDHCTHS
jgi:hypothetical protein